MKTLLEAVIVALIPALAVSVVTALLTVKLSLKQFRSGRWWERKAEAYTRIMEQLTLMEYCLDAWTDAELAFRSLGPEEQRKLSDEWRQAKRSVVAAAQAGSYLVSDGAAAALRELVPELSERSSGGDVFAEMDNQAAAVRDCVVRVRDAAKKDLGTR
jgi:hypothetical protein